MISSSALYSTRVGPVDDPTRVATAACSDQSACTLAAQPIVPMRATTVSQTGSINIFGTISLHTATTSNLILIYRG